MDLIWKIYNIERTICDILKERNMQIDRKQSNKVDINKI